MLLVHGCYSSIAPGVMCYVLLLVALALYCQQAVMLVRLYLYCHGAELLLLDGC